MTRSRLLCRAITHAHSTCQVPQHVLSQLSSILPLLDMLDLKSPVRQSLLSTVQLALFNADNLRRGIARESYHAGNAEMASVVTNGLADGGEGAAGELLGALDLFTGDKKLGGFDLVRFHNI